MMGKTSIKHHEEKGILPWAMSQEKDQLRKWIVDETITDSMSPREVYRMLGLEESKKYKYESFRTNLRALRRKSIESLRAEVIRDSEDDAALVVPPWKDSDEKDELRQLISNGIVTDSMSAREVYQMLGLEESKRYTYENFQTNLRNLRKTIESQRTEAAFQINALKNDEQLHPRRSNTQHGYPFWDTSEAAKLLKEDIKHLRDQEMPPRELHASRSAYQEFPLQVFRKHIYQERRSCKETAYWLHRRFLKTKKKEN